ncbi:MarR family winged helix-turn-helix transcriptional regulator [Actinacidiphila paucisporea]|uniref:DNA-binding transcriptional regulator, MarR family n=1 Tax=Actinacidiphila paucisporea TaxID=310782 RepID=A0A1M7NPC2_9ACTN|nr:MarR family transcriptional regulator [Actinacidiphila paucisporea]SHN05243.1 DNA-binding transcriptional regulator, MarR family [Actinacidiphila paucisporea]
MTHHHPTGRTGGDADSILHGLRRYAVASTQLAHSFASAQGLQASDLQALLSVIQAQNAGTALTPRTLREHLGLSAGGTSYVIDRLEASGHVRRSRDNPADQRTVHLYQTDQGRATARAFFGPLGHATSQALESLTPGDLDALERFLTTVCDTLEAYLPDAGDNRPT